MDPKSNAIYYRVSSTLVAEWLAFAPTMQSVAGSNPAHADIFLLGKFRRWIHMPAAQVRPIPCGLSPLWLPAGSLARPVMQAIGMPEKRRDGEPKVRESIINDESKT